MPEISEIRAFAVDLPLENAFETAKGSRTSSPSVIVELALDNGVTGLGSATPVDYVTGERTDTVIAAIELCGLELPGMEAASYLPIFELLHSMLPNEHSARAAAEIAVLDAFCKLYRMPMCHFFGGTYSQVETDVTIPIVEAEQARELASEAAGLGFRHLKIKVGGTDPEEDFERVLAVSRGAPDAGIRIDANQGFSPVVAVNFVQKLQAVGVKLDMIEQPVDRNDIDGLRYVTRQASVPVFADESVITPADAFRLIEKEAVDGINVKLMKCGISGALDIIATCRAARQELMLGCMIESDIGISTAVHLACGTGAFARIDLDAHLLLAPDAMPFAGGYTADGALLAANASLPGHGSASTEAMAILPSEETYQAPQAQTNQENASQFRG